MQFEQLGPYKIGRRLGRGGMGTVYAAIESASGGPAAVKVLAASLSGEDGFRDRFSAEIESLRKLSHPNIVRLLGFGEEQEVLYYAMELVDGHSLEEEVRGRGRFDWREATELGVQVCRALKHAHDRGIIHRDIKPANLLLASDGLVKLSDFGIAKLFGHTGITADGGVIGTAEYMAPEQADGRTVNHRCDLYSLGAVLYTLLAGRPPFQATTLPEMLQLQRFAEPEPLRRLAPMVPDELAEIVHQLLQKDPEARIPSALVLSRRLEATRLGLAQRDADQPPAVDAEVESATADTKEVPPPKPVPPPASPGDTKELRGTVGAGSDVIPDQPSVGTTAGHQAAPVANQPNAAHPAPARFTAIGEDEQRRHETAIEPAAAWISPQTWGLVGGLVAVAAAAWYFWQPPSADRLYQRITAAAENKKLEMPDSKRDISTFLSTYPADPRRATIAEYQAENDLSERERKFAVRTLSDDASNALTPIERAYLDAMRFEQIDPPICRRKLQALVELYDGSATGLPKRARECLALAHGKLTRLDKQQHKFEQDEARELARHAARATKLAATDPAAAQKLWQALIELYADKPWAQTVVDQARAALEQSGTDEAKPAADPR